MINTPLPGMLISSDVNIRLIRSQAKIVEFQKAVEPRFEYFHSYGQVLGENPHTQIVEDIYQEYLKLKTIIPDEQGEKDERNN